MCRGMQGTHKSLIGMQMAKHKLILVGGAYKGSKSIELHPSSQAMQGEPDSLACVGVCLGPCSGLFPGTQSVYKSVQHCPAPQHH